VLFSDDFSRTNDPGTLSTLGCSVEYWTITSGTLKGGLNPTLSYGFIYLRMSDEFTSSGSNQFPAGAFGGGLGGRLNSVPARTIRVGVSGRFTGVPASSADKFQDWSDFGYATYEWRFYPASSLPGVGLIGTP